MKSRRVVLEEPRGLLRGSLAYIMVNGILNSTLPYPNEHRRSQTANPKHGLSKGLRFQKLP